MPLFRSSSKSPKEVVNELREALLYLTQQQTTEGKWPKKQRRAGRKHEPQSDADLAKAAGEECAALLTSLKSILLADAESVTVQKSQLDEIVKQCYDAEVLLYLVRASVLEELPSPEARRDIVRIFRYFLERHTDNTVKYIIKNQALISNLISGYENGKPQVVANCGLMLRACSRYKSLVWVILLLKSDDVLQFFDFMQSKQFEVLSDAFVTFKELLRHEDLTAKFLEENQEEVFQRLSEVLSSDFYVTKHVCLEWLQELLNESSCVREYYYSSSDNLKTVMTLLGSDPSVTIRFKALDLMQGFLTITEKEGEVKEILLVNREKLSALVAELLTKFDKDEKHCPEPGRKFLLKTLEDPELSPALSELVPVESHMNGEELQPEPPQESPSGQTPSADDQTEPEQQSRAEQSPAQPQDQQPLLHVPTDEERTDEQAHDQPQDQQPLLQVSTDEEERTDEQTQEQTQTELLNEHQREDSDQPETESKEHLADQPDEEQPQIEKPNKDTEPEEQLNEHQQDNSEQPEIEGPLHIIHPEVEIQEQLQTEQPLGHQDDPSDQPEVEASHIDECKMEQPQVEQLNKDAEIKEEPLPLHSELETQDDVEELLPNQQNEDEPENKESLSDQPEKETTLLNHTEGKEPLPKEKELSPNQQKEDKPENEERLTDHPDQHKDEELLLKHSKLFPVVDEELPTDEQKESLLDHSDQTEGQEPSFDHQDQHEYPPDHSNKAEGQGALSKEQLFDFNFFDQPMGEEQLSDAHQHKNEGPTFLEETADLDLPGRQQGEPLINQSSKKAPPTTEQAEEHLHKLLEQLQDVLAKQPAADEAQPKQQLVESTEPDYPGETQETSKGEAPKELLSEPSDEEMAKQLKLQEQQLPVEEPRHDHLVQPDEQDCTKELTEEEQLPESEPSTENAKET